MSNICSLCKNGSSEDLSKEDVHENEKMLKVMKIPEVS